LQTDLAKYFNSLNNVDINDKTDKRIATATITETKTKKSTTYFEAKVYTYHRFANSKRFVLNVKIESDFSEKTHKTALLIKFSPKEFTHEVWETLNTTELVDGFCEN
jgi:hypothetical protein